MEQLKTQIKVGCNQGKGAGMKQLKTQIKVECKEEKELGIECYIPRFVGR